MIDPPWLPAIVVLNDHGANWHEYVDAVYDIFEQDFVHRDCLLDGVRVGVRRQPSYQDKWFTFWHCVSEGKVEDSRTPDLRRCERISWIRAIIQNSVDGQIDQWNVAKKGDERKYLWFREDYLVVLGVRKDHYLLITAFPTNREHTRRKLRKERDEANA
jgi:hypothetical protein